LIRISQVFTYVKRRTALRTGRIARPTIAKTGRITFCIAMAAVIIVILEIETGSMAAAPAGIALFTAASAVVFIKEIVDTFSVAREKCLTIVALKDE
jgi:L-alanine-DL-glutamate epimerase-like enolase superfamily enzyme